MKMCQAVKRHPKGEGHKYFRFGLAVCLALRLDKAKAKEAARSGDDSCSTTFLFLLCVCLWESSNSSFCPSFLLMIFFHYLPQFDFFPLFTSFFILDFFSLFFQFQRFIRMFFNNWLEGKITSANCLPYKIFLLPSKNVPAKYFPPIPQFSSFFRPLVL